ncbi:MAG TPA: 30S ribosomal protein S6 [Xanthobacteraceae bacterium]|nr:30S ribosomal protein S6 [Xanthobacteraceae bacterium]
MRRYETIFILRSDLGEVQVKDSIKRFEGLVATGGGEMLETDEWGFRELAYRIRNERRGYYVRLDYAATGPVMNEVERNLKLSDSVLRYLSVLVDSEVDTAKVRAEIEARLHRAAEAKAAAEARMAAAAAASEHPPAAAHPAAPAALAHPAPEDEEAAGEAEVAAQALAQASAAEPDAHGARSGETTEATNPSDEPKQG